MAKLLDERPIVIQPSIVKALGFERAVILQQIHYHLESPKSGKIIEGEKWIWNTYEEWAEEFTFWEPRTIRKWMAKLEEDGLIVTAQFDKADWNRRKYYRIDYEAFHAKTGASKRHDDDASCIPEDDATMRHHDDTSKGQHDDASSKEAETSTETSSETTNKDMSPSAQSPALTPTEQVFNHWKAIHNHPKSHIDPKRKRLIEARLKEGFTVDDLKQAIDGCKASPFHQGQNDRATIYDGLDLICREASKVEQFMAYADKTQSAVKHGSNARHGLIDPAQLSPKTRGNAAAVDAFLESRRHLHG